jgi:hypothetical protein
MTTEKRCFLTAERVCDLTCKAALEVDDPRDNVDCSFIWLALHAGEAVNDLRNLMEGFTRGGGPGGASFPGTPPGGKGPKGFPDN